MSLKSILSVSFLAILSSSAVFAQTAPLVSTPNSQPAPIVTKKRSIFLDIPILPMRKTIHVNRLRDGGLNYGPTLDPWDSNVIYRINIAPELNILSDNNRLQVAGGFAQGYDQGRKREDTFVDVSVDRKIWKLSAGAASFFEDENVDDVFEIVDLVADFSRTSVGGKIWGGFKAGSFSNNFITVNLGGGYIHTRGNMSYSHPILRDIDRAHLYIDEFVTYSVTAEGRKVYPRIAGHFKVEGGGYDGDSKFYDLNFQGTLEVLPLKRFSSARLLVRGNSHFREQDSLLFRTGEPELQVFLRIKIK